MATTRISGLIDRDNSFFEADGEHIAKLLGGKGYSTFIRGEQIEVRVSGVTGEQRDKVISLFETYAIPVTEEVPEPQLARRKESRSGLSHAKDMTVGYMY